MNALLRQLSLARAFFLPFAMLACLALTLLGQSETGELRLRVKDSAGASVAAKVQLTNQATNTQQTVTLPPEGRYSFKGLPAGPYQLLVTREGFAPRSELIRIRSSVPQNFEVILSINPLQLRVEVSESATLVDPDRTGTAYYIGSQELKDRPASGLPGRGLIDLVLMQPGWTAEANGILHPRESEYETQFVVNGFPEYDNRSPAFAPTIEADLIESVKVFTGGIPAEFGQKVGGVVEVNTKQNSSPGFHGTAVAQGGSFNTVGGFLSGQYVAGRTTASAAVQGFLTDRYLDPPVTENYSNHASNTSFTAALERDFSDSNHVRLSAAHRQTRFQVPNDLLQQAVDQRQDRTSGDSEGTVSYQHIFSAALVGAVRGMVRDVGAQLWSNPSSTPILAHQDRGFREGYLNASLAGQWRRHDWKTGVEARFASVREEFGYHIAAYGDNSDRYRFFDRDLPTNYEYTGHSPDREQAAYAQDTIRLGNFTASIGLRFDRYALLVNETGWSPRLGISWNVQPLGLVLHASYDRTFGTPPFENILVSAAPTTRFDQGLYLPVRPSRGNYYEGGLTQALGKRVRLDASYFHRSIRNFQDDDLLLNTGVSFPITFQHATVRGTEVKLSVPRWGRFSGYLSYANTIGIAQYPISGGLFLDDSATELLSSTGRFSITQDQRNTARAWARYQVSKRLWTAWSAFYNSGLPTEGVDELPDRGLLELEYGSNVVNRVNFSRSRVRPSFSLNASIGVELWRAEQRSITLQGDVMNLTDRLNLINFTGLLSGTGVGQPRSVGFRLRADF
jgi:hypothetical protein